MNSLIFCHFSYSSTILGDIGSCNLQVLSFNVELINPYITTFVDINLRILTMFLAWWVLDLVLIEKQPELGLLGI